MIKQRHLFKVHNNLLFWYKGPFDSRPNDSIGFGIANYVVNDRAKDKQIATNESRGYYSYDSIASDYIPIQDDELNVELNYTYQWSPAVMLRQTFNIFINLLV